MTSQAYRINASGPRQSYVKNIPKPRRLMTAPNRPSQRLVGPAAIAAYMLNDPQMAAVVNNLVASGRLGHHYQDGILCSTRTACRLAIARIERDVAGGDREDA